jgi:flagellar biosynthesis/type III secretory pathway protein FliH
MSAISFFEDCSLGQSPITKTTNGQSDPLEGYETGYQAGWDDAVKAHQNAQSHLTSTLTQNLEQVEFTLVEAQTQLLTKIRPVLKEIFNTLLPCLNQESLRSLVSHEIESLIKTHAATDISIVVSEHDEATVAALLNSTKALSEIPLSAKETLSEGQAYVTCATVQRKIDVHQTITEVQNTIDGFLNQPELEQSHVR